MKELTLLDKERAIREYNGVLVKLARHFKAWPVAVGALLLTYGVYCLAGAFAQPRVTGTVARAGVVAPTNISRDDRGFVFIRAHNTHDLFLAEGFAQASDRLFQMDLFRRYAYGQLAEILGPIQLGDDETMRALDIRDIARREWRNLSSRDRSALQAFSDGINLAMQTQPLPLEFRLLLYQPRAWQPQDSIAVTLAVASTLSDSVGNVLARDELWRSHSQGEYAAELPLSDPRYDVAMNGVRAAQGVENNVALPVVATRRILLVKFGSNAWAAGGLRTRSGHALLANDPHLMLGIPAVWYVCEIRAPGFHAAGATIAGIPGIVLGHNDRIAWGAANAMASTLTLFRAGSLHDGGWTRELFHVRFAPDVEKQYYRTAEEFAVPNTRPLILARWQPYRERHSAVATILGIDRAPSIESARHALERYPGPPQDFVLADVAGRVAFQLAGEIPDDPAWGRYVHATRDLSNRYAPIPFTQLPQTQATRNAVVLSANNKMYGSNYPYRLSPMFAPPYRAYRIAALLNARGRLDGAYFARMQLDEISPADRDLARALAHFAQAHPGVVSDRIVATLQSWDGAYTPGSQAATIEQHLRSELEGASASPYGPFVAFRAQNVPKQLIDTLQAASYDSAHALPWSRAGAVPVLNPLGANGFPFLNGGSLPGSGDEYTVRVQTPSIAQSFRAVWDTGNWNAGGISIPSGESGRVSSPHYDDQRPSWISGTLRPLPFSDAAVSHTATQHLTLLP